MEYFHCPQCGTDDLMIFTGEDELYCPDCDLYFTSEDYFYEEDWSADL